MATAVAAAVSSLRGARAQEADWLWLVKAMRAEFPLVSNPQLTDDILARFARSESAREREFFQRMEDRLRQKIPAALASADPQGAVNAVLANEANFLQAHEQAAATRVHAAIRRGQVKALSPDGAFWRLGPLVKEHTPDCVALATVGWWPWEVLDRIHPPMHPGCACELLTRGEAIDLGLMNNVLPDTSNAVERADEIARAYGIIQEAYWLETDSVAAIVEAVAGFTELIHVLQPRPRRMLASGLDLPRVIDYSTGTEMEPAAGAMTMALREADTETPKQRTGVMVALYPSTDVARDLSLTKGEHPDTLHVTLGYLGKSTELQGEDAAIQTVRRWAEDCPPLEGEVSGFGYFLGNPAAAGGKVTYASVDLPELPHQRQRLVDELSASSLPPRTDHGFTPHMTLDYASRRPALTKAVPLTFQKVTLVWGDNQYSFPLTGKPMADQIMEGLVDYAKEELERAGLFSKDSDYEGMLGDEILKIVKVFAKGGHSGGSAAVTTAALEKLLRYQPLTPLTSDPSEWNDVSKETGRPLWQSRRNPAAFSEDGGKTWEIMEASETLPLTVLDLEELGYDKRYAKGTIYGGRFMPKRGGFAPRVPIKDIMHGILGVPKPTQRGTRPGKRGMASPPIPQEPHVPTPPTPSAVPTPSPARRLSTPPPNFAAAAEDVRGVMEQLAAKHHVHMKLGDITPEGFDTEGWRDFHGQVRVGAEGAAALQRYAEMQARGQRVDDDTAGATYHTLRTLFHEAAHSVNPLAQSDYSDSANFALEEALTEEMAHVLTVDYLRTNGMHDALRWLARKPHDPRAQGTYRPQRAALATILDRAQVPVGDRAELLHQLSFTMRPQQRRTVLAGLTAKALNISPDTAQARNAKTLRNSVELDPIGQGASVLRPGNEVDTRSRIGPGAKVSVGGGRYEGTVRDAGFDSEGRWMVEVETTNAKGDKTWRYPTPEEVEVVKDAPKRKLRGDNVEGPVREGDMIKVTQANGQTEEMQLRRVEAPDALGWAAEATNAAGQPVLLRSSSVKEIKRVKPPKAKREKKAKAKAAPKERTPKPKRERKVKLEDVSGPLGFDARNYQDPRRSLITKIRAMRKGETLELADGSKIVRGQRGDSAVIVRPDGTGRRYATSSQLSNDEIKGVAERHGLRWDTETKKRAEPKGMASPALSGERHQLQPGAWSPAVHATTKQRADTLRSDGAGDLLGGGLYGRGFYASETKQGDESYGPVEVPIEVKLDNPVKDDGGKGSEVLREVGDEVRAEIAAEGKDPVEEAEDWDRKLTEKLQARGYDGVWQATNGVMQDSGGDYYVAFDPKAIRVREG